MENIIRSLNILTTKEIGYPIFSVPITITSYATNMITAKP